MSWNRGPGLFNYTKPSQKITLKSNYKEKPKKARSLLMKAINKISEAKFSQVSSLKTGQSISNAMP